MGCTAVFLFFSTFVSILFAVHNKIPKQDGWRFVSSWKASRTVRSQEKQPLLNSNEPSWACVLCHPGKCGVRSHDINISSCQVLLKIINMFMSEHKRNMEKVKRCEVPFKLVNASHFGRS
jgi:hypothetical protein